MRKSDSTEQTQFMALQEAASDSMIEGAAARMPGITVSETYEGATPARSPHPLVSVIIPTYNRMWTLGEAVRSVFDQTYRPIECLVIDDGSTDDTLDVVRDLSRECPKGIDLRYFRKRNGGPNSARNRGLLECKGDFICFLDSDDKLTEDSIDERVRVLIEDPDVDFSYGLCSVRDENGLEIRMMNEKWPTQGEPRISRYLFHTNSPLIRRSTCAEVGLWKVDDLQGLEYEYFSRLKYHSNKVYFINKVLSVYVRHKRECINNGCISFWLYVFKNVLSVKALVLYGKHDNVQERGQLAIQFYNVAKNLFRLRDYVNSRAALQESLIMKWNVKVFAQWLFTTLIAFLQKPARGREGCQNPLSG